MPVSRCFLFVDVDEELDPNDGRGVPASSDYENERGMSRSGQSIIRVLGASGVFLGKPLLSLIGAFSNQVAGFSSTFKKWCPQWSAAGEEVEFSCVIDWPPCISCNSSRSGSGCCFVARVVENIYISVSANLTKPTDF